jgi:hypothetical protein
LELVLALIEIWNNVPTKYDLVADLLGVKNRREMIG